MILNYGRVEKYYSDRGFGFVWSVFGSHKSRGIFFHLNPKPHFPSVHSCVILSKNSSINYLKSS